jgi:hypothetical protein
MQRDFSMVVGERDHSPEEGERYEAGVDMQSGGV